MVASAAGSGVGTLVAAVPLELSRGIADDCLVY